MYDPNLPTFKFAVQEDLISSGIDFVPKPATESDSGWDCRCAEKEGLIIKPFQSVLINLGVRAICPEGYWLRIVPRSSAYIKKHLHCLIGTIDQDYRKNLMFAATCLPVYDTANDCLSNENIFIEFGERIAQIIPYKRNNMNISEVSNWEFDKHCELNPVQRNGGMGSSGKF